MRNGRKMTKSLSFAPILLTTRTKSVLEDSKKKKVSLKKNVDKILNKTIFFVKYFFA